VSEKSTIFTGSVLEIVAVEFTAIAHHREWKIKLRRTVIDMVAEGDASWLRSPASAIEESRGKS
jgi:hypothetical protein